MEGAPRPPAGEKFSKFLKSLHLGYIKKDGREEMRRVGGNSQKNLKTYIFLRQDQRGGLTEHSG